MHTSIPALHKNPLNIIRFSFMRLSVTKLWPSIYKYLYLPLNAAFMLICTHANAQSMMYTDMMHVGRLQIDTKGISEIIIPTEGYVYYNPDLIFIKAQVNDSTDVAKVDFYLDSLHLGTDTEPPYHNIKLFNSPMGQYKLRAIATYTNGLIVTSSPVQIFVRCVPEDLDNNGLVNIKDFLILLGSFGLVCPSCHEDLNQDGAVNTLDYLRFLAHLGISCN